MAESRNFDDSPISYIARDHLFSILLLLPINSILSFATTCKRFNSLSSSNTLWEALCKRDWGPTCVQVIKSSPLLEQQGLPWIKIYKHVARLSSVSCRRLIHSGEDEPTPSPRASHSLNFVLDCLILFGGGCEGGHHLDDTWAAYVDDDGKTVLKWQKVNSGIPTGRFGHTCVVICDSLVVFGGINDCGVRQNDTWVGQVVQKDHLGMKLLWKLVDVGSVAPPPRGAHAACCVGNRRMLIYGGIGLDGIRIGDTWVLDLSENLDIGIWQEIVTHPSPPPRSGHSLTSINDYSKTVLFGGRGLGYNVLDDVWLFDYSKDHESPKWEQIMFDLKNVPGGISLPRVGHSATLTLGGRVLIYGGEDSRRRRKNDFWLLDVKRVLGVLSSSSSSSLVSVVGSMWRRLKAGGGSGGELPNARSFHSACTDGSGRYLYVFGGMMDGLVQPAESYGLRFNGEFFLVELVLS